MKDLGTNERGYHVIGVTPMELLSMEPEERVRELERAKEEIRGAREELLQVIDAFLAEVEALPDSTAIIVQFTEKGSAEMRFCDNRGLAGVLHGIELFSGRFSTDKDTPEDKIKISNGTTYVELPKAQFLETYDLQIRVPGATDTQEG
jgi:hypothetical protein